MIFKSTESFAVIPLRYSRIASFCAVVVTNLALLAALGWVTGASDLASLDKSYIPMAPSTSILFFLFSSSLSLFFWKPNIFLEAKFNYKNLCTVSNGDSILFYFLDVAEF